MPPELRIVREAWGLMGGLDWAAFPIAVEVLGVRDPEWLLVALHVVREHFDAKRREEDEKRMRLNQQGRA